MYRVATQNPDFFSPRENRCISITNDRRVKVNRKVRSGFDSSFPWLLCETGTEFLSPAVPEISVFAWELREEVTKGSIQGYYRRDACKRFIDGE